MRRCRQETRDPEPQTIANAENQVSLQASVHKSSPGPRRLVKRLPRPTLSLEVALKRAPL